LSACTGNDQWIDRLHQLDNRRGLNWQQTLPELYRATQLAGVAK
jgi:hypothetical protein